MSLIQISNDLLCDKRIENVLDSYFDKVDYSLPGDQFTSVRVSKDLLNLMFEDNTIIDVEILETKEEGIFNHVISKKLKVVSVNGISTDGMNHGKEESKGATIRQMGIWRRNKSKG